MNKLFNDILRNIIVDVRSEKKENSDEPLLEIVEVSHKSLTVFDMRCDDPDGRFCTIANPEYMTEEYLSSKVIIPQSFTNFTYTVDKDKLVHWMYENLPKEMWLTLQKIILIYDEEADFQELHNREDIGDLLEIHNLPYELLGITWVSEDIILVNIQQIIISSKEMLLNGVILEHELADCINWGIATTLIHEIRHVAQNNNYLKLDQTEDNESDAENYARKFVDEYPCHILTA